MADAGASAHREAIITGGSSGIGAALCRRAARAGWHVWIGYHTGADRAARLAQELRTAGATARPIALPLSDPDALRLAADSLTAAGAAPEALVLCGGPAPELAPFARQEPAHFRQQLEATVIGNQVLLAETWRRFFRPRGGGHVVAVLSAAAGPPPTGHMASYVVAKAALEALLRAAAAELGRAGLGVSVIRPGYVATPMLSVFAPLLLERARQAAPGGRFPEPADIARVLMDALANPPPAGRVAELELAPAGA